MSTEALMPSRLSRAAEPAPSRLRLEVYESLERLHPLRSAWEELLQQYPFAGTFSTWEWLSCWWRSYGHLRQLLVLALFDDERLAGLAPLAISSERIGLQTLRVLRLLGDGSGDSDNLDIPVRPGWEKIFTEFILQFLQERKDAWDVALFNTLPELSLVGRSLQQALSTPSWTYFETASPMSVISLPFSWEQYIQSLSSEDRKNLARYARRLHARYSVRIYRCADASQVADCLAALFALHQGRWKNAGQSGSFDSTERRQLYAHLSRCFLERRWLEFWILELDGQIAAAQFAFRYGDRVFQLQEGYDHHRSSDRPGFVLRAEVLRCLISEGVRTYDFLGGEDPYKARWAAQRRNYTNIQFARKFSRGALCLQSVDKSGRAKEWARHNFPPTVWSVLHRTKIMLAGKSARQQRQIS